MRSAFAANYHLNFPRQLSSGLVAQLVDMVEQSRGSVPENAGSNPTCRALFLSRAIAQKVLFGIYIRALLNHYIYTNI